MLAADTLPPKGRQAMSVQTTASAWGLLALLKFRQQ